MNREYFVHRAPFIAAVFCGAMLRLLWIHYSPHSMVSDEVEYHAIAARLVAGQAYGMPFWPPGWPFVLAVLYHLFGVNPAVGLYFNLLISVLTIILTGILAYDLFGKSTALIAVWVLALMPSYILPVALLRYEICLQFLLITGLWFTLQCKPKVSLVIGIISITALATLMRPLWIIFPLLLWLCARVLRKLYVHPWQLIITQIGALLVITPWLWYASMTAGQLVPVAMNGGINMWIGNNPNATGAYMTPPPEFWLPQNDALARNTALNYMLEYPWRTISLLPKKLWLSIDREPWSEWIFLGVNNTPSNPAIPQAVQLILNIYYWPVLMLALGSIGLLLVKKQYRTLMPLLLLAYSMGSQLIFFGTPRFRWTVQFLIVIYAAAFFTLLPKRKSIKTLLTPPTSFN